MTLKVLVCDDEPIAVGRIASLLARLSGVEVVATALDGPSALAAVERARPDLIFLDIEMPGLDGFEVARGIEEMRAVEPPLITFVTAFRRLAPEAFDSGAVDFLSKPVRFARLERSVERARRAVAGRAAERKLAQLEQRVEALQASRLSSDAPHVWVQRRGEVIRIDLDRVDRATAEGPYVRLYVDGASYLHREAIGSMEARFETSGHIRTHRSHIVRIDHIARIRRTIHGGAELILADGERIPVGRSYAKDVRRRVLHLTIEP